MDGKVSVSRKGKRIGKAKFHCAESHATARVKLSRKNARRVRGKRVLVVARAGTTVDDRKLRLKTGAAANAAAWPHPKAHGAWDAWGNCDPDYVNGGRPKYTFMGQLNSPYPYGDWIAIRFATYIADPQLGWSQWTNWWGWHNIRSAADGTSFIHAFLGNPYPKRWNTVAMQLYSYTGEFITGNGNLGADYLLTESVGLNGVIVSNGIWCYPYI